ncbi:MAG: glycosyltransferase, partial [Thermoanaerobaculia bacterium]
VGTAHGNRQAWIRALEARGVKVRCFGHGWEGGAVAAEDVPRIIRSSVISLNFSNSAWMFDGLVPKRSRQIKARNFEVPGAGGFLLTEDVDGLDKYLQPDRDVVVFRRADKAAEKIRFYLEHGELRDEIARAGHERIARDHTYDARLKEVLEFTLHQREIALSGGRAKRSGRIDWARFEAAAAAHRTGPGLAVAGQGLKAACSLFFGRVRGPRAARRLVYELSWRLAGARTYTAAGLPGRLFYRES